MKLGYLFQSQDLNVLYGCLTVSGCGYNTINYSINK